MSPAATPRPGTIRSPARPTGLNALITGTSCEGFDRSFSTYGGQFRRRCRRTPAVRHPHGRASTIGTVTTTGAGSVGLFATRDRIDNQRDRCRGVDGGQRPPVDRQRDNRRLGRGDHGHRRLGVDDGNRRVRRRSVHHRGDRRRHAKPQRNHHYCDGRRIGGPFANGTGSTVTATGVTITTHGNYDTVNDFGAAGLANQSYPGSPGGGVVTLTNSSILTTGTEANGVYTANGGDDDRRLDHRDHRRQLQRRRDRKQWIDDRHQWSLNTTGKGSLCGDRREWRLYISIGTTIGTTGNGSGRHRRPRHRIGGRRDRCDHRDSRGLRFRLGPSLLRLYNSRTGITHPAAWRSSPIRRSRPKAPRCTPSDGGGRDDDPRPFDRRVRVRTHAILSENGGTTSVGVSASGPTTLATTGTSAASVVAYDGGAVQLTGATVTTSGAGCEPDSVVHGATSSLSASGVTVTTQGGIDPVTGDHAVGADNAPYLPGGLTSGGLLFAGAIRQLQPAAATASSPKAADRRPSPMARSIQPATLLMRSASTAAAIHLYREPRSGRPATVRAGSASTAPDRRSTPPM